MFQPCLQGSPQYAYAKVAEREATERVNPAKHCRTNPPTAPAKRGGDTNAPEYGTNKKANKEEDKLETANTRCYDTTAQSRPESQPDRICQSENHAGREIATCRGWRG